MTNLPILLTSSIQVMDFSGKLNNPELRLKHTIECISEWSKINPEGSYVICDGSNYNFSDILLSKFPKLKIEPLFFLNDQKRIRKHGKGYGEIEIINYAIEQSKILNQSDSFVKCTGKLWVSNYHECLAQWNDKFLGTAHFKDVFSLRKLSIDYLDTRFYISKKAFFQNNFKESHLNLGGEIGLSIEDEFLRILLTKNEKRFLFNIPPIINGVGGGSGKYYKSNFLKIKKNKLRNWIAKKNHQYKDLFTFEYTYNSS